MKAERRRKIYAEGTEFGARRSRRDRAEATPLLGARFQRRSGDFGYDPSMSGILIRLGTPEDRVALAPLRHALWPEASMFEHSGELEALLAGKAPGILPAVVLVAEGGEGKLLGFLEAGLRSHADSCDPAQPVGYVEGWYVAEEHRHCGIGKQLLAAAEDWARGQGCVEMASDTQLENTLSQRVHESVGFRVVERAVLFRKGLR
jgi:aminoglycoside 6'-N-acetyltransferase I